MTKRMSGEKNNIRPREIRAFEARKSGVIRTNDFKPTGCLNMRYPLIILCVSNKSNNHMEMRNEIGKRNLIT